MTAIHLLTPEIADAIAREQGFDARAQGVVVEIELMEPMQLPKPAQPELRLLQGG